MFTKLNDRMTCEESGVTIIEYIMLAALIVVVCIAIITTVGGNTKDKFGELSGALSNSTTA